MSKLHEGDAAPSFSLLGSDGNEHSLKKYAGRKVVLYFYPKDDTPGCTQEACDFRDYGNVIEANNAVILGVSGDSIDSHQKFKTKHDLEFVLLSDPELKMAKEYGVVGTNGRLNRTTFIINEAGRVAKIYENVDVNGHVEDIIALLPLIKP